MKVRSLLCHSCNNHVAWHDANDVGVPKVYCNFCFKHEKMEAEK